MKKSYMCPICGDPMTGRGKTCGKCRAVHRRLPQIYICPVCGGKKSHNTVTCWDCYLKSDRSLDQHNKLGWSRMDEDSFPSINYDALSDPWLFQFVGLFIGEGTATIRKTNKNTYVTALSLVQRVDATDMLFDIKDKLGGRVHIDRSSSKIPCYRWQITRNRHVLEICNLILSHSIIPHHKIEEVALLKEFAEWRFSQPLHHVDWSIGEEYLEKIRAIRFFKVQG